MSEVPLYRHRLRGSGPVHPQWRSTAIIEAKNQVEQTMKVNYMSLYGAIVGQHHATTWPDFRSPFQKPCVQFAPKLGSVGSCAGSACAAWEKPRS